MPKAGFAALFLKLQGSMEIDFCGEVAGFEGGKGFNMAVFCTCLLRNVGSLGLFMCFLLSETHEAVLVRFKADEAGLFFFLGRSHFF